MRHTRMPQGTISRAAGFWPIVYVAVVQSLLSNAVFAAGPPQPSFKDPAVICDTSDHGDLKLQPSRLVTQMLSQYGLVPTRDKALLQQAKNNPGQSIDQVMGVVNDQIMSNPTFCNSYPDACTKDDKANLEDMQNFTRTLLRPSLSQSETNWGTGVTFAVPADKDPVAYSKVSSLSFLRDSNTYPLRCVAPGAPKWQQNLQSDLTSVLKSLRLRATADQLMVPANSPFGTTNDLSHSGDDLYLSNGNAKLSIGQTSGTSGVSTNLIGVLGVPIGPWDLGSLRDVVFTPYAGLDRENKTQKSKGQTTSVFSTNTADAGFALSTDFGPEGGSSFPQTWVSIRPDYLRNYLDGSAILSVNTKAVPITEGLPPINHLVRLFQDSDIIRYMLQFDLRANYGTFTDIGRPVDPRLNRDFVRIGGLVGPQAEIRVFPDNPIDISVTYADFYAARGFNKSLGLFQAAASFNFDSKKIVSLTLQYANGRREDTAERVNLWSASLALRF